MDIARLAETTQDTLTVRKVFGEAYERDGTTVIPAATIRGGAGGGGSRRTVSGAKHQEGEGGGFGINATPAGVYVLSDGKVRWCRRSTSTGSRWAASSSAWPRSWSRACSSPAAPRRHRDDGRGEPRERHRPARPSCTPSSVHCSPRLRVCVASVGGLP